MTIRSIAWHCRSYHRRTAYFSRGRLVAETQKRWLRKAGLELWEVDELSSDQRRFVLDWAEKQGMFLPWRPSLGHYDVAVILGATTPRMQLRLDYLKQLWAEGVPF